MCKILHFKSYVSQYTHFSKGYQLNAYKNILKKYELGGILTLEYIYLPFEVIHCLQILF